MQFRTLGYNPNYSEQAPTLEQVTSLSGDAIIEFGAPWCPHCQAAMPAVEEALSDISFKDLQHIKIYDGKGKSLGRVFKVKRWPTLILLRNGTEIARIVRPLTASDVHAFLQQV